MKWFQSQTSPMQLVIMIIGLVLSMCLCGAWFVLTASIVDTSPSTTVSAARLLPEAGTGPEPTATNTPVSLQCFGAGGVQIGGQAFVDFCYLEANAEIGNNGLESLLRGTCDLKHAPMCDISVWFGPTKLPTNYPLTDVELSSRLAQYKRNENTGYECFNRYDGNDSPTYSSAGCR